ncbi:ExbD/TolR family protein [Marinobacter arenosus]|uniref:ExbD/TolR family protein n=1 Tax=Marinobacter arenosus TaxID=2856822 RepID=UPI001C4BFD78|nr:biopolymer transporter ExbD [Marinobacter arenosus]MBW0148275.1 biopolymer transporter ExbD [Marinobacter arenosus]
MQLVEPRPRRPIPIRITPLIDVVFILLVFFMLTSRLLPVGFLELGNATPERTPATGPSIPELTVIGPDEVLWQDKPRTLEDLMTGLAAAGISEVNLTTRPDTELGAFTRTLSRLDSAGIDTHWKRATTQTP